MYWPDSPSSPAATAHPDAFRVRTDGQLDPWVGREWLLTNGVGGFASSTVVGCNARRYHATLCAATLPPVGRVVTLSRLGETLFLDGDRGRPLDLSVNLFADAVHPRGDRYLRAFGLWHTARWEYDVEGVGVTKELLLCWRRNVVGVRYTVDAGRRRGVRLEVAPFTPLRDFHAVRHRGLSDFAVRAGGADGRPGVTVADGPHALALAADTGWFDEHHDWWYGHRYPLETDRGLDDREDLFTPGRFGTESDDGRLTLTVWASVDPVALPDWDAERRRVAEARGDWSLPRGQATTRAARRLVRAADDFVVARTTPGGDPGTTVIAGYPWFADWGRDTFIGLPGLLLTTGRFEQARQVLTVFGHYVDQGMIPNRFDDYTNEPAYNTVDASLWYVHAAFEYARLSGDRDTFERVLRPACRHIVDGYRHGTRFRIRMDPADGLVTQGDATTQLTWMDAKCGDVAFTPRQGKAVEINALWYHALVLMGEQDLAARVADGFRAAFWLGHDRGLADVVHDGHRDEKIRPNQIFAASLPNSPLGREERAAVVEVVRRELLTPVGLRTLARSDPGYHGAYHGPQIDRDAAYHNGTIWPWLIGPFLTAYLRAHGRGEAEQDRCREWLRPLVGHIEENCLGQVAEIFEAEEPHRPVGCPAQAWSVAEVLRLAVELGM
ncbi:MAG: hypothetical protein JWO31_2667 [Phycisphaerales bacterium]|nr:hypothetical protein [Phycisphaerales bacterium]